MIAVLLPHTGAHCAEHAPLLACLPPFFRRALRMPWRKPSVPAVCPSAGTDTAFLYGPPAFVIDDPEAPRYACCTCCEMGSPCDPRDNHLSPCEDGCNGPAPSFTLTAPTWTPSRLAATGELQVLRPVNGRNLGDQPRLDREAQAEQDRAAYVRSHMAETERADLPLLERVRDAIRNLDEPGFGVDRCEADVLEAEQLAGEMIA